MKLFLLRLDFLGMKRWSGGIVISGLAFVLLIRYSFVVKSPQKQSAYDFFRGHENGDRQVKTSEQSAEDVTRPLKIRIKPQVVDFEGLSVLYELGNFSEQESNVLDVWRRMRVILSRSDALPDTALGIIEAEIAWKQLVSTIKERKPKKLKDCPYYVSTYNDTSVEIPCGFVEDSSITLMGTPNSQMGSFQIEVIGSRLHQEPNSSVLLHYEVFLPGKNASKNPLIIQNTWTNASGWGKEERCPDHSLTNSIEVDGLAKCNSNSVSVNKQEEASFSSNSTKNTSTNHFDGGSVASGGFPFAENVPFTATLWAGVEGFHMSVNGRHETSFSYREKLEPWLVNGVKVKGDLDIMSLLANRLPVSEGFDFEVDLKAPPLSKKRLVLLIGVCSTGNNFERRMALRRSWMQYDAIRKGDVAVRFLIGLHKNEQVNLELWREAQAYGDVQLMPFVDYYSLLTLKTIGVFILGIDIVPAKYIMKTDDDAFVRVDEVLKVLKDKASQGIFYGQISFDSEPHRDKDSKWYISPEEWPHSSYPPWAHGPGYIISRDIAKFIVQGHRKRDLMLFKLEDVAVGVWIEQFKQENHKVEYLNDDRVQIAGCEAGYVLAHYQNPRMLLCLWDILQKDLEPNCCE